jgi:hypothetical protein
MNDAHHFTTPRAGLLAITVLLAQCGMCDGATAQTRYGKGLGRLLTSESERTRIDQMRFHTAAVVTAAPTKEKVEEAPVRLSIEGITNRPSRPAGQRINIWINGKPYAESDLPQGLSLVRSASGEVMGVNSLVGNGKTEFAKIGDSITRPQTPEEAKAANAALTKKEAAP